MRRPMVEFDTGVLVKGVASLGGNVLRWWCKDPVHGCRFGGEVWWDGPRFPNLRFLAHPELVSKKGLDTLSGRFFDGGWVRGLKLDCKRGLLVKAGKRWYRAVMTDDYHPDPWRGVTQQLFKVTRAARAVRLIRMFAPNRLTFIPHENVVIVSISGGRERGWVRVWTPSSYGEPAEYTLNIKAGGLLKQLSQRLPEGRISIYGFTNALVLESRSNDITVRYILRLKAKTEGEERGRTPCPRR